MRLAAQAGPSFLLGGGLKIVYDSLLLTAFRHIRPPEEAAWLAKRDPARSGAAE